MKQKVRLLFFVSFVIVFLNWFLILVQKIEVGILERKLITCTTPGQVRKLLVRLAQQNPSQPLWSINKKLV